MLSGRESFLKVAMVSLLILPNRISFNIAANSMMMSVKQKNRYAWDTLTGIFLTEDLGQTNSVVDRSVPCGCLECEFDIPRTAVRNRRKLEEITGNDKLDTTPGPAVIPN